VGMGSQVEEEGKKTTTCGIRAESRQPYLHLYRRGGSALGDGAGSVVRFGGRFDGEGFFWGGFNRRDSLEALLSGWTGHMAAHRGSFCWGGMM